MGAFHKAPLQRGCGFRRTRLACGRRGDHSSWGRSWPANLDTFAVMPAATGPAPTEKDQHSKRPRPPSAAVSFASV